MTEKLFDIKIGYASPRNPIAVASMAGITDSKFASGYANAGLFILGGYNLDKPTNEAARKEIERGRTEFVSDKPLEFLKLKELVAGKRIHNDRSQCARSIHRTVFGSRGYYKRTWRHS